MAQLHLFWQNLKANFQSAGGWIAKTATIGNFVAVTWIGLSVVVCTLIVQDLLRDVVTIEPIEVPKALSDTGYTSRVASYRLRDALNAYAEATSLGDDGTSLNSNLDSVAHDDASLHSNLDLNIAARDELPDVVVPQIGLSLGAIISSIRSVLHRTGHAISGELTLQDGKYALRVRVDGRQVFSTKDEAGNPDDLMTKAAPGVMDIIRPSVNAMAQYHVRKEEGLLKADEIIAHYDESDINVQWAYLLKGNHALRHDHYDEAERMFAKARLHWNNEQLHMQLGALLLRQAKPEKAKEQFEHVVAINPKSAIAHNSMGVAWAALAKRDKAGPDVAKLDKAIAHYLQAIAAEPRYALAYNNHGLALSLSDRIDEAIGKYRSAIEIAPKYLLARWNLASALQKQRSFDAALTEYRVAIEHATDTKQLAMLHTSLGDVLREKAGKNGNLEAAILEYRRAIDIHPRCYSWAHNNLGLIWYGQGKINDAIAEFGKAANCDPEDETIKENLEQALRAQEAGGIKATSLANQ